LLVAALTTGAPAGEIAELTIPEQAGAARTNEPVRMGIPLGKGVAKEVTELALTDAGGKPVPCQFREVMRWPEDKSLRWVHAVFQASVPAKGNAKVKLVKGAAVQSDKKVEVAEAGGNITVSNGLLKLVVKGPNFNLFDSASLGGAEIVKPHNEGFVAVINGKPHKPGADSKAEVEEKGSEGAVIKVTGKLVPDGAGPAGPFSFACYIHVYAGSPVVKVSFSYTNCQADPGLAGDKIAGSKVALEDLSLVLPTALGGGKATVGGDGKNFSGKAGKIFAKNSDLSEITVDGAAAGTAKGKSTKPQTIGWVDLASGDKGLAVGCRWFWQMFPKAMEVTADGKLRAALWARENGKPLDVYMGQGRTHYLTFLFHGPSDDATLSNFFAGTQMPLRALASPKYYCQDSQAFGPLAEANPALYPADLTEFAQKYDGDLRKSLKTIEGKIDGWNCKGVTLDSYGYMPWGDLFHWANKDGDTDPWNILWESNYYDFPWACLLQFARTGELEYLTTMDRNGLHLADVFMLKWHPEKKYWGACRYSPPANFVGLDDSTPEKPLPYFSVEFNHHKAQSILARYLLLGDFRARDDFMLALTNATLNSEGSWRQCRGAGAKLCTLYEGWQLTGDQAVMDMFKKTVAAGAGQAKKGGSSFGHSKGQFMYGIASEGLVRYWWITKDEGAVNTVKVMNDWLIESGKLKDATPNSAMSMGFLWRQTGDDKYREATIKLLKWGGTETRPKGFGQSWRNTAYAWYYLSNLAQTEKNAGAPSPAPTPAPTPAK